MFIPLLLFEGKSAQQLSTVSESNNSTSNKQAPIPQIPPKILTALRSTGFRATQGECSIPLDLANKIQEA